jgi:hypothetical protein
MQYLINPQNALLFTFKSQFSVPELTNLFTAVEFAETKYHLCTLAQHFCPQMNNCAGE